MIRAGRSCPSPMSAVRTSTRGGLSSARLAPASSAPAAWSLPFSEGRLPGTGSGGRVVHADPLDVLLDPFAEAGLRLPLDLLQGALVGDDLAGEVARPRRRVDDLAVVGVFLHPLGDLEDRHDLVAGEVVGAPGGLRLERGDDPVGEVLDVDEAAGRAAVAGDRQRLAFEGEVGELGDDAGGAGAGAVGDAEAQHRRLEVVELAVAGAVGLPGQLRRRVEVARRRDRRFLVDLLLDAVAVDPGGRAVDDAADLGAAGGLEHVEGAAGVDLLGEHRVGEDVADVGDRREVDDRVAVAHRQVEVGGVGDAAGEGLDLERRVVRRGAEVEDPRRVAAVEQPVDDVGADEAAAARDQDPHAASSSAERRGAALGAVVERHAPVVLRHPVGVGQLVGAAHDPVAGLLVDPAGALLDLVEDDVLVEARGHPLGQLEPRRMDAGRGARGRTRSSRRRSPPCARPGPGRGRR